MRVNWGDEDAAVSNENGTVEVPLSVLPRLRLSDPSWKRAAQAQDELEDSGVLWVFRVITIEGRVYPEQNSRKLEVQQVRVRSAIGGDPGSSQRRPTEDPWNREWLESHGFPDADDLGRTGVDAEGRFSFEAPMVQWMVLVATADGWRPNIVDVPATAQGQDHVIVNIPMFPAFQISGTVVDRQGHPIPGAVVRLMVHRDLAGPVNTERLQVTGYAFCAVGPPDPYVVHEFDLLADSAGRYRFSVPLDGDCSLAAHAIGHSPARLVVGELFQDEERVDLEIDEIRGPHKQVSVLHGSRMLPSRTLGILDVTNTRRQVLIRVELTEKSTMSTDWLETGRRYLLHTWYLDEESDRRVATSGFLTWDNREVVDLESLEDHPDEGSK